MEEITRGLTSKTRHSSSVLQAMTSLHTKIRTGSEEEKEAGIKVLWTQLGNPDSVLVCRASADLLDGLVRSGDLEPGATITQLLACLSQGMEYCGLIPALGSSLCLQAEAAIARAGGRYPDLYSISSKQHPFVSVLRSTPAAWSLVSDECLHILDHPVEVIKQNRIAILKPVLLYLFCDPNYHLHFGAMRSILLDSLLYLASEDRDVLSFLMNMQGWMKLDNKNSLKETSTFIYKMFDWCEAEKDLHNLTSLAHILPSLALYQVKYGYSTVKTLKQLDSLLDMDGVTDISWDAVMVVLQVVLDTAPHTSHGPLLRLAMRIMPRVSRVTAGMMVVTCLQSLPLPAQLPGHQVELKAEFIRLFHKTPWSDTMSCPPPIPVTLLDSSMREAMETVKIISSVSCSASDCENWLTGLTCVPHSQLTASYPLLTSVFLCPQSSASGQAALKLLLQCVKADPSLSTPFLSLILHKLATDNKDPDLKLSLLHALPSMAADKTCISLILKLVSSLSPRPGLAPLRLTLLYKLWRVEARAYPFLQKALLEPVPETCALEFMTTQAVVIRDIVRSHAASLGTDLLPILSNILNQATSPEAGTASAIALEGIHILLQHSIIDMKTTIKVLAPKCSRDQRPAVLIHYIRLLGLAPTFKLSGSEYSNFLADSVKWLWQTATSDAQTNVIVAAYKALGNFPLELTQLRMLPAAARRNLKLPAKFCATPAEAARRPEDVLPYVPSECWGQLVVTSLECEALVTSLVRTEVTNLPRAVYSLSQAMKNASAEPVNYSHLPEASILRGLVGWLIEVAASRRDLPRHPSQLTDENQSLNVGLRVLATDHGRPLPPLDWSLLEPLFSDPELRWGVISVLSRQAASSLTAKMIIERQLRGEQGRDAVMAYISCLELLVPAVSGQTLGPWLTKSLQTGLHAVDSGQGSADLITMLQHIRAALQCEDVSEASVQGLAGCVETLHEDVSTEHAHVYQEYLLTAAQLPVSSIERLSSPSLWWEVTESKLFRAAGLRSCLALTASTDTPLTWLNEILEAASKQTGDHTYLLRHLLAVLTKLRTPETVHLVRSWLLELMGQISSLLRLGRSTAGALMFLLDVFFLTVVVLAETDILVPDRDMISLSRGMRLDLLGVSVARLCRHQGSMAGQLADWCSSLLRSDLVTSPHRESIQATLRVFRDAANWQEATLWGKLVMI